MKKLFQRKEDGNLSFGLSDNIIVHDKKAASILLKQSTLLILVAIAFVVDLLNLYRLFTMIAYDSIVERIVGTGIALYAFEVAPLYIGLALKQKSQGYKVNDGVVKFMAGAFAAGIIMNYVMRFCSRGLVLVRSEGVNVFSGGEPTTADGALALAYQLFTASIPVLTSIIVGGISYMVTDYLGAAMHKNGKELNRIREAHDQLQATVASYSSADIKKQLEDEDYAKYRAVLDTIDYHRTSLEEYTRIRIAEMLGDPTSTNILTNERKQLVIRKLENIKRYESAQ